MTAFLPSDQKMWAAITGTAFAGLATGSLTFVSAVDVRSFLQHLEDGQTDLIQRHFGVWWPNGRDLMVPIGVLGGTLTNLWAYWQTKNAKFAAAAGLMFFLGPYTVFVLGEDIETLRQSNPKEVEKTTRRFCNQHHVRLVAAGTGFGLALLALAEL